MTLTLDEPFLDVAITGRHFPGRGGRPMQAATYRRWILVGVKNAAGERVRLEAVKVGRKWLTTIAAINRFLAAQSTPAAAEGASHATN